MSSVGSCSLHLHTDNQGLKELGRDTGIQEENENENQILTAPPPLKHMPGASFRKHASIYALQ